MNYYGVWKTFNKFFIHLDIKPNNWEDRLTLFIAYLIETKKKSSTIKSYVSAIKAVLLDIKVKLNEDRVLLAALMKACKIKNNQIKAKLPINHGFLNILLSSLDTVFLNNAQPYLKVLYRAVLSTMYFGLFRIGEVTQSSHVIKARDVHIGLNKKKLMLVLHSSKTHGRGSKPQIIKISSIQKEGRKADKFCPFKLLQDYVHIRKSFKSENEQFFIF